MRNIDNDIKTGQLKNLYLLYGEERYLIRQYRDKLKNALSDPDDTMNASSFGQEDLNANAIIDLAETMPFFAERRLILIEDSGWGKKTPDEIGDYLQNIPEFTFFVFVEKEVDKRSKLYKAAAKKGYVSEFGRQTENLLARWVGGRIRREGKQMTQRAYEHLILKTGTDMETIDKELEKLLCYTLDKETIDLDDVEAIVTDHSERKIFDMVDALASHQPKKAMDQYYDLIAQREPALLILHLLTRQFHNMMIVKAMVNRGSNNRDIAAQIGASDWLVRKYQNQCRPYDMERLRKAVADGIAYEEAVKTGKLTDTYAVELFIVEYSK